MAKPFKPLASAPAPQQPSRRVVVAAAALGGFVATTYELAREAGSPLETSMGWSRVATLNAIFLVVAFAVVAGSISLRQLARRQRADPMMLAYVFLVAFVALGYGAWEAFSVPVLIAPASSLPGAASPTIQFR